jgi:hypothetical protein
MVEINPPLNFYLHVPPVLLSELTGIDPIPAFILFVMGGILIAFALCLPITRQARAEEPALWIPLLATALATSLFVPMGSFGQREHVAVALSLPYFFASAVRGSGRPVARGPAVVAGLMAGIVLSLKPYFLLAPLLLELREVVRGRRVTAVLRPDSVVLVAVVLLYGISVPIFHPEYLRDVVPMALATYSLGFGVSASEFLVQESTVLLVAVLGVYAIARRVLPSRIEADTFWLAAVGFFGAYLWQMKGFPYHVGPVLALVFVALMPIVTGGPLVGDRGLLHPPHRLLALTCSVAIVTLIFSGGRYPTTRDTDLYALIEREAPGGTIAAFGSNMSLGFPLVLEADLHWASRFPTIWPVPGVWHGLHGAGPTPSPEERRRLEGIMDWTRRAVAEDLQTFGPDLVVVDDRPRKSLFDPLEFDWIEWAEQDSLFRAVWEDYVLLERLGPITVYERSRASGGI